MAELIFRESISPKTTSVRLHMSRTDSLCILVFTLCMNYFSRIAHCSLYPEHMHDRSAISHSHCFSSAIHKQALSHEWLHDEDDEALLNH